MRGGRPRSSPSPKPSSSHSRTRAGPKGVYFVLNEIGPEGRASTAVRRVEAVGYTAVAGRETSGLGKLIPNSRETTSIEFTAPEECKRLTDFRVDVQQGFTAELVPVEASRSLSRRIVRSKALCRTASRTPRGVRVPRPQALVMLKLQARYDRYHNIRGPQEARHDREDEQTHATDIVAIVKARPDLVVRRSLMRDSLQRSRSLGDALTQS